MKTYWTLLKAVLINDIRKLLYHPKRKNYSNIISHLIFPLFLSSSISLSLFQSAELYYYSFFILTFSMLITTLTLLIELSARIIRPDDLEIWMPCPISGKFLFFVKVGQVLIYILLLSALTSIIPSILITLNQDISGFFGLQLWITILFANTILALILMALYIMIGHLGSIRKSKNTIVIFQIIIALLLVGIHQWGSRLSQESTWEAFLAAHSLLKILPSVWFNALLGWTTQLWSNHQNNIPIYFLILFVGLTLITVNILPKIFLKLLQKQTYQEKQKVPTKNWIQKGLNIKLFSDEYRSGTWLAWHLLKRDKTVLIPMIPPLTFPLIILFFRLYEGQSIQFISNTFIPFQESYFPYLITSLFFTIFLIHNSLQYAKDYKAFWGIQMGIKNHPEKLYRGIRWTIFTYLVGPLIFLLSIVYVFSLPVLSGLLHGLILFLMAFIAIIYFNWIIPILPFSQDRQNRKNILLILVFSIIPLLVFEYLFYKLIYMQEEYRLYFIVLFLLIGVVLEFGGSLRIRKKLLKQMKGLYA